jgi:hypothetical protein
MNEWYTYIQSPNFDYDVSENAGLLDKMMEVD